MGGMAKISMLPSLLLSLALLACAAPEGQDLDSGGKADSPFGTADLIEGTAPAVGLLRFVNDPATSVELLKQEVGLRSDAASNIVGHREGQGGVADPFDDVRELDEVPRIGPSALQDLLDFAFDNGFVPQGDELLGTYDDVSFTVNQANAVLQLVNTASPSQLDDDLALDGRAVDAIIEARPIQSVMALSTLSFVGSTALEKLRDQGTEAPREFGVISDLDKTVVPPAPMGQALPDTAYAGIAEMYNFLEFGEGAGVAGDIHYVTARQPSAVVDIPAWLSANGVPQGSIDTGISGIPTLARDEKIRDITAVFEATGDQRYVLFGDSSHVDPDVYRSIISTFGDRVEVAFIHNVKTIDPARLAGLVLVDNYAQAAAELMRRRVFTEDQARMAMQAVVAAGEIDAGELEALIDANRPN